MPKESPYEKAFNEARARYRITGAGGVTLPGGHSSAQEAPKQNPSKHVNFKDGIVTIGGSNVKTSKKDNSSIRIFNYGKSAKEDKKN